MKSECQDRPRIGFHAGIAGGLHNALLKAQALGADTVQIFSRNPRGWKARPLENEEVERGLQLGADYLVVHPGSARGACEADALRTCAESLNAACEGLELGDFRILLENT